MKRSMSKGFTLVEVLVVLAIIGLVTAVALPIATSLNGRQVSDGARIFTGAMVGTRDSAIRYNEPRGFRLMPDPTMTIPPPGQPGAGTIQLCYNRIVPIEPAGDYSQGKVTIGPQYYFEGTANPTTFPPAYTAPDGGVYRYPFMESPGRSKVLMLEESPYVGGFLLPPAGAGQPNPPTNWYWNIRVGDRIKLHGIGRSYTVVGPCTINPWASTASGNQGNPEMFVNVGPPGTLSPLERTYYIEDAAATPPVKKFGGVVNPEFLFLVNGEDDTDQGYGHWGYADEGFDGKNNNSSPPPTPVGGADPEYSDKLIDDLTEWEDETWGNIADSTLQDAPTNTPVGSPSGDWVVARYQKSVQDVGYAIKRRPVPSPGAREVMLPAGTVIDATTWNTTRERSRIPVEPGSLYCDVMVNPGGEYIPTTLYSTPTSADPYPFLHFWVTDRSDVFPRGALWGLDADGVPKPNPSDPSGSTSYVYYELPLASDTPGYTPSSAAPALKSDRRLVTMFTRSGLVVTNTIETVPAASDLVPGEGFKVDNVNYPFLKAQQGLRGEK